MTRKQILRRYDQLIRQCFRDMEGGLEYGTDWHRSRQCFPTAMLKSKSCNSKSR